MHTHPCARAHIHTLFVIALLSRSHDLRNVCLSTCLMLPNVFLSSQTELPDESPSLNFLKLIYNANMFARNKICYLDKCVPWRVEHSRRYIDLLVNYSDSSRSRRCSDTLSHSWHQTDDCRRLNKISPRWKIYYNKIVWHNLDWTLTL